AGFITGFAIAGLAVTGLAMGLGAGLFGFTVTFDVAGDDVGLAGGRTAFFLGAAALCAAFFGIALPGRLAALFGFFEGICSLRSLRKSARLYRRNQACTGHLHNIFSCSKPMIEKKNPWGLRGFEGRRAPERSQGARADRP